MNILSTNLTLENFVDMTSSYKKDDSYKNIIPIYYVLSKKSNVDSYGMNPVFMICELFTREFKSDEVVTTKNPGKLMKDGALIKFDTWTEGIKAHIDLVGTKLGFNSSEFRKTRHKICENEDLYTNDEITSIVESAKRLGLNLHENRIYGAIMLNKLYKDGKITDYAMWRDLLVLSSKPITNDQMIYLLRKITK